MTKKPKNNTELERLTKFFAFVYESNFVSYRRMLLLSFVRGVAHGIGAFIGATIGISILLWLASLVFDIPLLGGLLENLRDLVR